MTEKIALGTVQFGLDYGIANREGKPTRQEALAILESACKQGIDTLDTAYAYGDSEEIIGEFIAQSENKLKIISKMPDSDTVGLDGYFQRTLNRLKQQKIYGYLVHRFDNLSADKKLWNKLQSLQQTGLVEKIGLSLYKREELDYLLDNDIRFDMLEVPYNVFDRRFEGYFPDLRAKGIELYVRSVFLQGLFFLEMEQINRRFQSASSNMERLYQISQSYSIPVYCLCLGFVLLNPFIDKVIIGVNSREQLKQDIGCLEYLDKIKNIYNPIKSLEVGDEELILPYNWR